MIGKAVAVVEAAGEGNRVIGLEAAAVVVGKEVTIKGAGDGGKGVG